MVTMSMAISEHKLISRLQIFLESSRRVQIKSYHTNNMNNLYLYASNHDDGSSLTQSTTYIVLYT